MEVLGLVLLMVVFYLGIAILMIASWWKIYTKAGQPGWAAIIPIYNVIVWLKVIEKPWWWLLLLLVPIANIVILILMWHNLAKCFGKDVGFTIGLIFLNVIFVPILGLGSSEYQKANS